MCPPCANGWTTSRCWPSISWPRASATSPPLRRLSPDARDLVRAYSWPGNVRQLENTLRRLMVTSAEAEITRAEVEAVLGNQPAMEPLQGGGEGEKLSASVAKHLKRYFDLHGGALPPAGRLPAHPARGGDCR